MSILQEPDEPRRQAGESEIRAREGPGHRRYRVGITPEEDHLAHGLDERLGRQREARDRGGHRFDRRDPMTQAGEVGRGIDPGGFLDLVPIFGRFAGRSQLVEECVGIE